MRARDGACGSGDVIAIVRTGLSTVGELVDCNLVDIARTRGIAADRGIVIEHTVNHRPGLGLIHGVAARAMVGTPSSAWRRWNAPVRPERNAEEGCAALA